MQALGSRRDPVFPIACAGPNGGTKRCGIGWFRSPPDLMLQPPCSPSTWSCQYPGSRPTQTPIGRFHRNVDQHVHQMALPGIWRGAAGDCHFRQATDADRYPVGATMRRQGDVLTMHHSSGSVSGENRRRMRSISVPGKPVLVMLPSRRTAPGARTSLPSLLQSFRMWQ